MILSLRCLDAYSGTSVSKQDETTGTYLLSGLKKNKTLDKICKRHFKTLCIMQQRTVMPETGKPKKVIPMVACLYCLERVSRLWPRMGKPTQKLDDLQNAVDGAKRSGRSGWLEFTEKNNTEKIAAKRGDSGYL